MAPRKLFKIGEVIRYSGVKRQTLHNYTMMGIIREAERTESGHRLYDESVFTRLEKIAMLRRHRSLREVQELLAKEDGEALKKEPVSPGKN
jgi:DNA-binding transcriptional MerR regulator